MATFPSYSFDAEVPNFFPKTSATRKECDLKATALAEVQVILVTVQVAVAVQSALVQNWNMLFSFTSHL